MKEAGSAGQTESDLLTTGEILFHGKIIAKYSAYMPQGVPGIPGYRLHYDLITLSVNKIVYFIPS